MDKKQAQRLGEHLRRAREAQKLSTRQVAERAGVDMSTVVRIENGAFATPRLETVKALAEALDIPISNVYALAQYVAPTELPSFQPYLRAKYGKLPPEAVDELERSFERLAKRYGYDQDGPEPGEDET